MSNELKLSVMLFEHIILEPELSVHHSFSVSHFIHLECGNKKFPAWSPQCFHNLQSMAFWLLSLCFHSSPILSSVPLAPVMKGCCKLVQPFVMFGKPISSVKLLHIPNCPFSCFDNLFPGPHWLIILPLP